MKKKFRLSVFFLLILSFISTFFFYYNKTIKVFQTPSTQSDVHLVVDSWNYDKLPPNFRKSSNKVYTNGISINLNGLDTLNISGSHQFSAYGLDFLVKSIGTNLPITIVDLRQESHGFINGIAVSWDNEKDNANLGLTREQVISTELKQLESIPLNKPLTFYNDNKTITPRKVETENQLANSNLLSYVRIPVTDRELPDDTMVDYFVNFVKSQTKDCWLHFHCKEGIGRTTKFMIMYDIMKNCKNVALEDIINRQIYLANFESKDKKGFYEGKTHEFLTKFYNYCKSNNDNFKTTWSEYNKNSSIK